MSATSFIILFKVFVIKNVNEKMSIAQAERY